MSWSLLAVVLSCMQSCSLPHGNSHDADETVFRFTLRSHTMNKAGTTPLSHLFPRTSPLHSPQTFILQGPLADTTRTICAAWRPNNTVTQPAASPAAAAPTAVTLVRFIAQQRHSNAILCTTPTKATDASCRVARDNPSVTHTAHRSNTIKLPACSTSPR